MLSYQSTTNKNKQKGLQSQPIVKISRNYPLKFCIQPLTNKPRVMSPARTSRILLQPGNGSGKMGQGLIGGWQVLGVEKK